MREINPKLAIVATKSTSPVGAATLLASDLDGTLIPPPRIHGDGGIAALKSALEGRHDLAVAYVTGRSLSLALDGVRRHSLPPPTTVVCDVGTSVFLGRDGEYSPDPAYRELMFQAVGGRTVRSARAILAELDGLELQPDEHQSEFKLSYFTPRDERGEELASRARERLEAAGRFRVVYSIDHEAGRGLLDVLPRGVAKDFAVRYLHDRSGVHEDQLLYAGDSGNDVAAMLTGFQVVVVGNADAALKESIAERARERQITARVYFAEASYAAGVLEGCLYFGIV